MIDADLEHSVDVYLPTGTSAATPYVCTIRGMCCLIEPTRNAWRQEVRQVGQFSGRRYKMTWGKEELADHCRVYWPAKGKVFELQYDSDDTNRLRNTTIPAYQTADLLETQVPHLP